MKPINFLELYKDYVQKISLKSLVMKLLCLQGIVMCLILKTLIFLEFLYPSVFISSNLDFITLKFIIFLPISIVFDFVVDMKIFFVIKQIISSSERTYTEEYKDSYLLYFRKKRIHLIFIPWLLKMVTVIFKKNLSGSFNQDTLSVLSISVEVLIVLCGLLFIAQEFHNAFLFLGKVNRTSMKETFRSFGYSKIQARNFSFAVQVGKTLFSATAGLLTIITGVTGSLIGCEEIGKYRFGKSHISWWRKKLLDHQFPNPEGIPFDWDEESAELAFKNRAAGNEYPPSKRFSYLSPEEINQEVKEYQRRAFKRSW